MTAPVTPTEPATPTPAPAADPAAPTDPPASTTPPADEPKATPAPPKDDPKPSEWEEIFKGKTPAQIKAAVDEATKWERRSKGNKQQLERILDALGADDPKNADPAQIADELSTTRAEARATKIENAVLRTASKPDIGANLDALLDSRSFMDSIGQLDPTDSGFHANVEKAIKDAVKNNPALKAAGARIPTSSGPEVTGDRTQTPLAEQLAAARKAGNIPLAIQIQQQMKLGNRTT